MRIKVFKRLMPTWILVSQFFFPTVVATFSPKFDRSSDVFLLSKILNYQGDSNLRKQMKTYFLKEIGSNEYMALEKPPFDKYNELLIDLEKNWLISASPSSIEQFEILKNKKTSAFNDYEDLTLKIRNKIGNHFSFDEVLTGNSSENERLKKDIVNLYKFILNANLLSSEKLFKSVYAFKNDQSLDEKKLNNVKAAATSSLIINQYAMILVDFSSSWNDPMLMQKSYINGFRSTNHYFSNFVHEMGHVIIQTLSLKPIQLQNLNMNIALNPDAKCSDDIIDYNIAKNFQKNHQEELILTEDIINESLDEIYKNFELKNKKNEIVLKLAQWTSIPSFYGRQLITNRKNAKEEELIAEAFAYYVLTPKTERTKIWEWWHKIFTQVIPWKFN